MSKCHSTFTYLIVLFLLVLDKIAFNFGNPENRPFPTCKPGQSCIDSASFSTPLSDTLRLDVKVLARECGFRVDSHKIVTQDDYILTAHRLINPLISSRFTRGTIILQHGTLCASSFWLLNKKPNKDRPQQAHIKKLKEYPTSNSLAIALVNHGYDVWLTNFRGNQYGRRHQKRTQLDYKFWDFNIDSIIQYDFESNVRYILRQTNSSQYTYIGHSLGATVNMGALIEHRDKPIIVKQSCSILLAPVASTQFINGSFVPFLRMATMMYDDLAPFPGSVQQLSLYAKHICHLMPKLCKWAASMFVGLDKDVMAEETLGASDAELNLKLDIFTMMMHQSVSIQMLKQILQVHSNGRLAKYDYGYTGNKQVYGHPIPPSYDLLAITANKLKMLLIGAPNDLISTKPELDWIFQRLSKVLHSVDYTMIDTQPFNHLDLVLSYESGLLVNEEIIRFIEKNRCFPQKRF